MSNRDIHFAEITAKNVRKVCRLTLSLSDTQKKMVANNAFSIAQHHCSNSSWAKAICINHLPIGFLMVHFGSYYDDGIDCPGAFLWRFMIAREYQGKGYGKQTLDFLVLHLKEMGYSKLYSSCVPGELGPEKFYLKYGFEPTGETYGEGEDLEIEIMYKFNE